MGRCIFHQPTVNERQPSPDINRVMYVGITLFLWEICHVICSHINHVFCGIIVWLKSAPNQSRQTATSRYPGQDPGCILEAQLLYNKVCMSLPTSRDLSNTDARLQTRLLQKYKIYDAFVYFKFLFNWTIFSYVSFHFLLLLEFLHY